MPPLAATPGPTMADMKAMKRRQKLILHRLAKVCNSLGIVHGFVGEVRHALQEQNDLLHKVQLHLDTMQNSYLQGLAQ